MLGPAVVTVAGEPAPPELLWRKHLALFVYLARSPRRARTREHLVGLLWSERDEKAARHSLSEALRVFRRVLGEDQVRADVDQVSLGAEAVTLDCDELAARSASGDWGGAAALVQGEFLEGLAVPYASEFETWLAAERLAWRARGVEALTRDAERRLAAGDLDGARGAALRALDLEPASEPAARAAVRSLALAGDRGPAIEVADRLARELQRLGAALSAETQQLVDRVRAGTSRAGGKGVRQVMAAPEGASRRPPLVGRQAALHELSAAWGRARAGAEGGELVLIEGEPGEGKTRLLDELLDRVRLEEASVAACRAVPADANAGWSGLAGLLAGGMAAAPGVAGAAPEALAVLAAVYPELPGGGRAPARPAALSPAQAFAMVARAVAEEHPLLLALDDANYLDAATAQAMPQLARDMGDRSVLLVLCVALEGERPAWVEALRAELGRGLRGTAIRLERLDAGAMETLARWWLPRYSDEEIARLVRRVERDTGGVPLLVTALLDAVAAGLRLGTDAPAWPGERRTLVDTLPGDLPPAVIGAICLRYRQLPESEQEVLAAAAALGERIESRTLAMATALDAGVVDHALDRLEWDRWLAADARGFVFAAPIVRAVLLQEIVTPGRVRRYRAAASV